MDHLCYLYLVFVMLLHLFIAVFWPPADLLAPVVVFIVFLLLSNVVSWVRCGT